MNTRLYKRYRDLVTLTAVISCLWTTAADAREIARSRHEGTLATGASNVAGSGNITAFATLGSGISQRALHADLRLGGILGLAEIMQIQANASLIDFQTLGPIEARLQITTPGNDRLRFAGVALSADLFLPTSQDTIALTADSSKPEYNPSLLASAVIDFDWLALNKAVPLKTYLFAGLADNPQLLYKYNQLRFTLGAEWKLFRHSFFADCIFSLYREKAHKLNDFRADAGFEQQYLKLAPGLRYRIRNRFSLIAGAAVTMWSRTKSTDPLLPDIAALTLRFEAPIYFRETNTEAIRSLVFMEQRSDKTQPDLAEQIKKDAGIFGKYSTLFEGLDIEKETFDYTAEKEKMRERREHIQERMKEIEELLQETE